LAACPVNYELSQYRFHGVAANSGIDLQLATANPRPVELLMDWGDAEFEQIDLNKADIKVHHVYKNAGQYGSVLSIIDGECTQALYFSVVITPPGFVWWWIVPAAGAWLVWAGFRWQRRRRAAPLSPPEPPPAPPGWNQP
jgi:hypothetical protein